MASSATRSFPNLVEDKGYVAPEGDFGVVGVGQLVAAALSAGEPKLGVAVGTQNDPEALAVIGVRPAASTPFQSNGQCVEVGGVVAVRDSKHPTGPVLTFTPDEWRTFIDGAKDGKFDLTN